MTKEERINTEIERLELLFEKADSNKHAVILPLLQNAAFMKVTLEDLQKIVNSEGATDEYQNGAHQHGVKQSATLQSYNALIKNYSSVQKQLLAIVPLEERAPAWKKMFELKDERTQEEREAEWEEEAKKAARIKAEIEAAAEKQRRERENT